MESASRFARSPGKSYNLLRWKCNNFEKIPVFLIFFLAFLICFSRSSDTSTMRNRKLVLSFWRGAVSWMPTWKNIRFFLHTFITIYSISSKKLWLRLKIYLKNAHHDVLPDFEKTTEFQEIFRIVHESIEVVVVLSAPVNAVIFLPVLLEQMYVAANVLKFSKFKKKKTAIFLKLLF